MLVIALAATTVLATFFGGMLALRAKDRFHLVLGLSAGLLLGLVGFDLLPEVFEMSDNNLVGVIYTSHVDHSDSFGPHNCRSYL